MKILNKITSSYKFKSALFLFKSFFDNEKTISESEEPIVIVFAVNDRFMMMLSVAIKSLLINHKHRAKIIFYIMDDGVSQANKDKLLETIGDEVNLNWIKIDDKFLSDHQVEYYKDLSTTYYRFLIEYFIPHEIKKVIYLDCDLVIRRDIWDLWSIDFEENVVLAVQDTRMPWIETTIKNFQQLHLNPVAPYFNAGIMVIDLEKWRKENISEKLIKCIIENKEFVLFDDQYGMNVILFNRWKSINPNWNIFPEFYPSRPFILHYVSIKPSSLRYANFNKHYFYHYLDKTAWKGWRPE